jgi:hypothetical protein
MPKLPRLTAAESEAKALESRFCLAAPKIVKQVLEAIEEASIEPISHE